LPWIDRFVRLDRFRGLPAIILYFLLQPLSVQLSFCYEIFFQFWLDFLNVNP